MSRVIGTHAGCGGQVMAPVGWRFCSKCMLTSHVASIELTADSVAPPCRACRVEITDENVGQWPSLGCCASCERRAIGYAIADAQIAANKLAAAEKNKVA